MTALGEGVCDCSKVGGSGLSAGRGLSSLRVYVLDDRGVSDCSEKILGMTGDSNDGKLLLL